MKLKLTLIAVAYVGCLAAHAQTHFVALNSTNPVSPFSSWATAATNIQDAIDVATNGALVLVTNGVYQTGGRVVHGGLTNRVAITKPMTVKSVNGPAVTIIKGAWDPVTTNGDAAVRCAFLTNQAVLIGFTLTNGATRGTNIVVVPQIAQRGGGAIGQIDSVISNCVIVGNTAFATGGGVQGGLVYRSVIRGNRAPNGGGARLTTPVGVLFECVVDENVATSGGGGVHSGEAHNSLIVGNVAGGSGGGANSARLVNCTVVSNSASTSGGGIFQGSAVNSIVYLNINSNFAGTVSFTNSCTTPLPSGINNITNDPLFVSTNPGNYRLQFGSPVIGLGDNTAVVSARDLDGKPRILNGTVDMGAYEFGSAPQVVTLDPVLLSTNSFELRGQVNSSGLTSGYALSYLPVRTFASDASIPVSIPSSGVATPYPSTIAVSGVTGGITALTVTLNELSHTFPADLDVLLVGPQGQSVILMSDVGGTADLSGKVVTFSDNAPQDLSSAAITNRYYRPTNLGGGDLFPAPAVTNALGTNLAVFAGTSANGTWSLFIRDAVGGDSGSLSGWSLAIGTGNWTMAGVGSVVASTGLVAVTAVASNLSIDTLFFSQLTASNEVAVSFGQEVLFRTPGPPLVQTLSAVVTGPYQASLRGLVDPNLDATSVFFEYGLTTNYGSTTTSQALSANAAATIVSTPALLFSDAVHHFRVVASNSLGIRFGADETIGPRQTRFVDINNPSPAPPYLTWGTAATNIQDAIDAASARDLVIVSNGTYEVGVRMVDGVTSNRVAVTNVITVQSVNGPQVTVIRGAVDPSTSSNGPAAIRGVYLNSNAVLSGFTVTGGVANDYGGGIRSEPGGVISNCVVVSNLSDGQGGGVFGGNLYNCLVESNRASVGGGIAQPNFNGGTTFRSIIRANRTFSGVAGGMLYGRAVDCLIVANVSVLVGGGVSYTELYGCTVVDNTAFFSGGGAYGSRVFNSILYFNFAFSNENYEIEQFFGATSYVNSCTTPLIAGPNNTTNDPRFASLATGDFRLRTNSPCINAGDNALVLSAVDVSGNPRVRGGVVDMGALEFSLPPSVVTLTPTASLAGVVLRGQVNPEEADTSWYIELLPMFPVSEKTLTNAGVIVINDNAIASPYPSIITVSGFTGRVFEVEATLESLSHTFPEDIDMLLRGPEGQSVVLMSDVGGGTDTLGARLVFDDQAATNLTTAIITNGTYRPTNRSGGDTFPFPATTNQLGTNLAVFASSDPNGTWSLFVVDDAGTDTGVVTGWSLRVLVAEDAVMIAGGTSDATNVFLSVSNTVAGLVPGTPYRYRVVASNTYGVTSGAYVEFVVPEPIFLTNFVALASTNPVSPFMSWATAATNIQDAVDVALDGATIFVSNGVYETGGRVSFGAMSNRVVVNKPVTVRSVNGPAVTTIRGAQDPLTTNGNAAMRGVLLTNGASLVGFTVSGGGTRTNFNQGQEMSGGGIWASTNSVVSNCVVSGNSAFSFGGGIVGGRITHATVVNNRARQSGGGLSFFSVIGSVTHSVILENFAEQGGGLQSGSASNCLLARNVASSDYGGAINASLANCTVVANTAAVKVGGVSGGVIFNSIIVSNVAPTQPNFDFANFSGSLIQPGSAGGNITNSPLFVDFAAGNYRLLDASPGVHAGSNLLAAGSTDLDGNPRIIGGRVDIGAYENLGLFTDRDNDGATDYQEFVSDTVPTNAASFFRPIELTNAAPGTMAIVLQPTSTGRLYFVEATTNLIGFPQVWQRMFPEVSGSGATLLLQVTNEAPHQSYRTGVRLP